MNICLHIGLLSGKRTPCRLRVKPHPQGSGILGLESFLHDSGPHPPGRTELCNLFEKVHVRIKKEGKSRGEIVHSKTPLNGRFRIRNAIGQREGQLLHCCGTRLPDVIPADTDRIPAGNLLCPEFHRIRNHPN